MCEVFSQEISIFVLVWCHLLSNFEHEHQIKICLLLLFHKVHRAPGKVRTGYSSGTSVISYGFKEYECENFFVVFLYFKPGVASLPGKILVHVIRTMVFSRLLMEWAKWNLDRVMKHHSLALYTIAQYSGRVPTTLQLINLETFLIW